VIRAVLEGIAFNLNLVLQALQERIGKPKSIQATGGLAKSYFWRQILADVFAQEITVPASYESSCLGAVVLGLYALKKIPSLDAVTEMLGNSQQHQPIQENVETYQKIIPLYTRLLHHLQSEYTNITHLQEELNR
jgi:gluconokinase